MAIDIAGMDAAQKLAFAQAVGSVKLAGGMISSDVPYADIALPSGYGMFKLLVTRFFTVKDNSGNTPPSSGDNIAAQFSFDGGTAFLGDLDNFDSYQLATTFPPAGPFPATPNYYVLSDAAMGVGVSGGQVNKLVSSMCEMTISPGDSEDFAQLYFWATSWYGNITPQYSNVNVGWAGINPGATIAPTPARANFIRVGTEYGVTAQALTTATFCYILTGFADGD
jgi:hypothetical protein